MGEEAFALKDGEKLLREAACCHFVRPRKALIGRLCRAYLTDQRLVFCEAFYDIANAREKGLGPVLHEFPLLQVEDLHPEASAVEPSLRFEVSQESGAAEPVLLCLRDPGWHMGQPERAREFEGWIQAVQDERKRLGIRPRPKAAPAAPAPSRRVSLAAPPPGAADGQRIGGKYELAAQIGEGGMGLVFRGVDLSLGRPVAIKKMRPEIKVSARDKTAFLREAMLSASLHHPFIVDIYEILEVADEDIYLVFEFVDGQTVTQLLEGKQSMEPQLVKRVLRDVCEALAFAHSRRIAHRDLKPSNIMLTSQGHAKVMDFGIARLMKDTTSKVTHVDASGTMAYMAPEQELGKFSSRSDIYALGATVYEMLTGDIPFAGPNFYLQKEKMAFSPVDELAPDVPSDLAQAVARCLRFDPAERFQTIEEFARAIGVQQP